MVVLPFSGQDWKYYKESYGNRAYFKEKIMACLYFQILKKLAHVNHKYTVIVDNDSWMDVYKSIDIARKLAKANNYDFDFTVARATQNDLIRIVDYIASSYDKMDKKELESMNFHKKAGSEISGEYLDKVFR